MKAIVHLEFEVTGCHDCKFKGYDNEGYSSSEICNHPQSGGGYAAWIDSNSKPPRWCPIFGAEIRAKEDAERLKELANIKETIDNNPNFKKMPGETDRQLFVRILMTKEREAKQIK